MSFRHRAKPARQSAGPAATFRSAVVLSNESQELYADLRAAYLAQFEPAGQVETDLVDRIVACQWRLQRTVSMETAAINLAMRKGEQSFADTYGQLDSVTRAAIAIHSIEIGSGSLTALQKAETALSRGYKTALSHLVRLQARRRKLEGGKTPERT